MGRGGCEARGVYGGFGHLKNRIGTRDDAVVLISTFVGGAGRQEIFVAEACMMRLRAGLSAYHGAWATSKAARRIIVPLIVRSRELHGVWKKRAGLARLFALSLACWSFTFSLYLHSPVRILYTTSRRLRHISLELRERSCNDTWLSNSWPHIHTRCQIWPPSSELWPVSTRKTKTRK